MAEIKSAVELAMERTKGLRLSHEEKEKLKEDEIQTKAHALVNKYLEVDFHLREVERELARFDPPQRHLLERLILQNLIETIDLERDNDLIFQGILSFRDKSQSSIARMKDLILRYRQRKSKDHEKIEKELLATLERLGISGTAVQPKVEGSPEWEEALGKFKPAFENELGTLKKEIKP